MTPDQARKGIINFFRKSSSRPMGEFKVKDYEHLIEPQLNIILKKGKGAWDSKIAKQYVEQDFPNLFKELGSSD